MAHDRMKAKRIPGEHCRFCGDKKAPLIKTECCNQWICCDTKLYSYRGGGRCLFEHEHESLCYSHYIDGHSGKWQECEKCRDIFGDQDFERRASSLTDNPRY